MNWDRFWDLMSEPCIISDGKEIVRLRKTKDAEMWEVIPKDALAEYNRLLENMQRMGVRNIAEMKELARREG